MNQELFDWITWRNGSLVDLDCFTRTDTIVKNASRLKRFAVGFADAGGLLCRPKAGYIAVMFFVNGKHFWTHLTAVEFEAIHQAARQKAGV